MTRGRNSRAQNRGRKHRMAASALDACADDMDRLASELGVPNISIEPEEPRGNGDMSFGLPEVLATCAVYALAGIINMMF